MDALDRYHGLVGSRAHLARPLARVGLGVTILLAGAHKMVAPGPWHAYLAPLVASLWPTAVVPLDPTFVLFGASEVVVGALLVVDRYASLMAAVVAVSMVGVDLNLALAVAQGEPVVDVLVRDVGLTLFAAGVMLLEADR